MCCAIFSCDELYSQLFFNFSFFWVAYVQGRSEMSRIVATSSRMHQEHVKS